MLTVDCEMCSRSLALVRLPASAASRKARNLWMSIESAEPDPRVSGFWMDRYFAHRHAVAFTSGPTRTRGSAS